MKPSKFFKKGHQPSSGSIFSNEEMESTLAPGSAKVLARLKNTINHSPLKLDKNNELNQKNISMMPQHIIMPAKNSSEKDALSFAEQQKQMTEQEKSITKP